MAFGAERGVILRSVVGQSAKLACHGIAAGLILSLDLKRLLTSMLVGIRPMDPLVSQGRHR
jgi:predicted lysophospholipase L1 biosynthesis ABC-type transport system permease subunit